MKRPVEVWVKMLGSPPYSPMGVVFAFAAALVFGFVVYILAGGTIL